MTRTFPRRRPLLRVAAAAAGCLLASLIVLSALVAWPLPETPNPGASGDFVIRNVAVVDVVNQRLLGGRDVVVRNGRIASIDARRTANADPSLAVVDGSGKFLMPGLWDMHVHSLKISPQYTHPLSIANGVTGVREMWGCAGVPDSFVACGDDIERWRKALAEHRHLAPRYIQHSSYAINGERGVPSGAPAYFMARDAAEARQLAAHHAAQGVDLLKVYTHVSPEAYEALTAEASQRGMQVAGHLPARIPLRTALAAGQRSVEHPRIFLVECHRDAARVRSLPNPMVAYTADVRARLVDGHDRDACARLMAEMAASTTWWSPTLQVLRMSALADDAAFRNDPRQRYIPRLFWAGLWKWDADAAAARSRDASGRHVDAELYSLAKETVRQAHVAGVQLVAGTDAGDTFVFPGFAIHDELAELVSAGIDPAAALRSATIDAARFAGKDEDHGSIAVGKLADMVLLDGDPLSDIANTRRIAGVFFNGHYLDRAALDSLLRFAEQQARSVRTNLHLLWGALRSPILWAQAAD